MTQGLHVVLGANGPVGQAVVQSLVSYGVDIRQLGRQAKSTSNYVQADLTVMDQMKVAVFNASVVYLCAGVPYSAKEWEVQWPLIIETVIEVLRDTHTKLVFFDNVYLYGPKPLQPQIKEDHARNPSSKKGKIRLALVERLETEVKQGHLDVVIARSADFFGPYAKTSLFADSFIGNMWADKRPNYLGRTGVPHTFAYVPDLGKALALLGLNETKPGETYHLPVYTPKTIEEITAEINLIMKKNLKVNVISKPTHAMLCLFIPMLRELFEMRYQFDYPYILDDTKFMTKFPAFQQTSFMEALETTIDAMKPKS